MKIEDMLNKTISMDELLHNYNANVSYKRLPKQIDGFIFSYKGIYNIYISLNKSLNNKKKVLLHELAHIELNHLTNINKDIYAFKIKDIEDEADEYIEKIRKEK